MTKVRIFQRMPKVVLLEDPVEVVWDSDADVGSEEEWGCASGEICDYVLLECFKKKD